MRLRSASVAVAFCLLAGCASRITSVSLAGPAEGYVVYFKNGAGLGALGSQQDCERSRESDLALRTRAFAHRLGITTDDARTALAKEMSPCTPARLSPSTTAEKLSARGPYRVFIGCLGEPKRAS